VKDIMPDLPDVFIDREQIKRVFINLFENAIEAMGGKGRILVTAKMAPSGMAQIEVADEGPGIAVEDVPKLFQPDFSRKKKKSGLGLAIVLRIITDHSGTISVSQNDPAGARFIIELPVAVKSGVVLSS
jgi:two-component system, NtrC family, nitrogen regulation sensor histidine kinase NtrY